MEDFIYIGRVANTHGIKGMIKVLPTTDDPTRYELLKEIFIEDSKGNTKSYTITRIKYFKQLVLLQLKEVTTMDEAIALKQGIIKIPKALALPLEKDEFYVSDLIGVEVYTEDGEKLGMLKDIIFTGSNDVYVIDKGTKKDILIPAIKDCIKNIDIEQGKMTVHLLEGLVD